MEETEFEVLTPLALSIWDQHSGRLVRKAAGTGLFIPFHYCDQKTSTPPCELDSTSLRKRLSLKEKALSFLHLAGGEAGFCYLYAKRPCGVGWEGTTEFGPRPSTRTGRELSHPEYLHFKEMTVWVLEERVCGGRFTRQRAEKGCRKISSSFQEISVTPPPHPHTPLHTQP